MGAEEEEKDSHRYTLFLKREGEGETLQGQTVAAFAVCLGPAPGAVISSL